MPTPVSDLPESAAARGAAGEPMRLTSWTSCGGCAAKWGASSLDDIVGQLAAQSAELLVGLAPFDDAAVFRVSDDVALVSTTDFFPPLVDDPGDFGAIAAANACSDVFAMGGRVVLALNISAFPEDLPAAVIGEILAAAAGVVAEAGGVVAGGHTIRAPEPIFGLAVQGLVDPRRVWTKGGARPGQTVVLSKPLGTGIVLAGDDERAKRAATRSMRTLNRWAAEVLAGLDHAALGAVTDVTGYGLLGHGWEVASRSGCVVRFDAGALPLYEGALAAAEAGVRTGGDARNRAHLAEHVRSSAPPAIEALAFDPQTSGGLLATVDPGAVAALTDAGFVVVGDVAAGAPAVELA